MRLPLKAFADEMEKIAISERYFLNRAKNAISRAPTGRMAAQYARAVLTADRKGFKGAKESLLKDFGEWKRHAKRPSPGVPFKDVADAPGWSFTGKSFTAPKSKKKLLRNIAIGTGVAGVTAAGAYGVHRYNKKQLEAP